jgi:dCMP deaminase
MSWDEKYLRLALHVAGWSKDPSTKVGAVIVGQTNEVTSLGYNGPPRGVNDNIEERWTRPLKYQICEHAERNAIFNAARHGATTMASTIYIASFPTKFGPCDNCCRAIIQAGIARVVYEPPEGDVERWKESFQVGETMLNEAGIEICTLKLEG